MGQALDRLRDRWHGADGQRRRALVLLLLSNGSMTTAELERGLGDLGAGARPLSRRQKLYGLLSHLVEEGHIERLPKRRGMCAAYAATDHALTVFARDNGDRR